MIPALSKSELHDKESETMAENWAQRGNHERHFSSYSTL
jgi:hypothetical protein